MKIIRTLLFTLCFAIGFAVSAQNIITATEAHITITTNTTREDLMHLRNDLKAQGIDFKYQPQFDNERKIVSITFTVSANDGAITGSGAHTALKTTNASVTFHVNKTTGTFTVDAVAAPTK